MSNRLAQTTSPYLQQHADNPVDWHPWDEKALTLAREQDKPILLSVGYSACHWCHVMAHESFEDPEIAAIMNQHFINIKVDREERPDLDQIYQLSHQMLTQRAGGWPLTMFLTPDGKPFFGGTYYPKEARYNLPGFGDLLLRVAQFYREERDQVHVQNEALLGALKKTLPPTPGEVSFSVKPLEEAMTALRGSFDAQHGGFGGAPKFPHPTELEFSLRRYAAKREEQALHIATFSLGSMALGGIYDHLGGGFCRYSVDSSWTIPHFEKMLYDNGPLLRLTAEAWAVTGNALFERVTRETAAWTMREMQSPEGGYYSTLDADSEGEEGKFYVWSRDEMHSILSAEEYAVATFFYGLDGPPNFENTHWHLRIARTVDEVAARTNIDEEKCDALILAAKAKLFAAREQRVHPGRDEKILTSWNALMIQGMARAGFIFGNAEWIASARRALDFIRRTMWQNGRLLATYKAEPGGAATAQASANATGTGSAHLAAYLDDYAFLLAALIELLQTDYRQDDLAFAEQLAAVLLDQFEDKESGGFFFTAHDHEALIHRPKSGYDNATPSGNGVAALALTRLHHITGNPAYRAAAEGTLRVFHLEVQRQSFGYSSLLMALEETLTPTRLIVIRGQELASWRTALASEYYPHSLFLFLPQDLTGLPANLDKPASAQVNAWVCMGVTCLPPIDSTTELLSVLKTQGIG
jgi:uncharacterized protein